MSQAYVISRICYATPYLNMNKAEIEKVDRILRKCAKRALGLPTSTSTARLEKMGVHNRWVELAEGVRISQLERLGQSETGRTILEWVGIRPESSTHKMVNIPAGIRAKICVPPMPRNMHPVYNKERREHRAKAYERKLKERPADQVAYVDAACGQHGAAVSAVVDGAGVPTVAASSRTRDANAAEELAIALACVGTKATTILSDSKTAVRNFAKGRISEEAKHVLEARPIERNIEIIWIPAHESIAGNEAAHELARALYHRAAAEQPSRIDMKDGLISYHEITEHYKLSRRVYPPPDRSLGTEEAIAWRRLQGGNHISPFWVYITISKEENDQYCITCGERGTLDHVIWECAGSPGAEQKIEDREAWETLLRSEDPAKQRQAIRLAAEAVKRQCVFTRP
ncbi:uncharacterized protein LOC144119414 [Amblyomma americanum]